MKRTNLVYFLIPCLLWGCDSEQKPAEAAAEEVAAEEAVEEETPERDPYAFYDPAIAETLRNLDAVYKRVPFYAETPDGKLFYVANHWEQGKYREFPENQGSMGLVTAQNELVLPLQYDKIGNPDALAKGWVEVEQNGRYGLFNYENSTLILCDYLAIFPAEGEDFLAYGKTADGYEKLLPSGDVEQLTAKETVPTYSSRAEKWRFDVQNQSDVLLRNSYGAFYQGERDGEGTVIFITPSYLFQLGAFPEYIDEILLEEEDGYGVLDAKGELHEKRDLFDRFTAFVAAFLGEVGDGRSYLIDRQTLVVADAQNNVLGREELFEDELQPEFSNMGCAPHDFHFLTDSLVEVWETDWVNDSLYENHDVMRRARYLEVLPSGEIKALHSDRFFTFTQYVRVSEEHFKGFYGRNVSDAADYDTNFEICDHLEIADLDVMRNEIFAAYGYRFQTEKWQEYFNKKPWYKPKYDNVERFLTPLDRANLEMIAKVKARLEQDEQAITNKRRVGYAAAG